jgi:ABC-type bacteriocin/lantibiotic exporter with double-glycine peptidase domain
MANDTSPLTPIKRFISLLKIEKTSIYNLYIFAVFAGLVNLSVPLGVQAIINFITAGAVSTSWIVLVVIVIAGIAAGGVLQILQLTISEGIQQRVFVRSSFEFAFRIPRFKLSGIQNEYAPELVNRFFDTISVQKGMSKILIDLSGATLQIVFGLILLSFYHPFFILYSFLLVALIYILIRVTGAQGLRTSLTESKYKYQVVHWLEELARTMETFKLAGKTDLPLERTDALTGRYIQARKSHFRILVIKYMNLIIFKVLVAAGLLILGGLLVINQQMNLGQFVGAEIIIILVISSVEKLVATVETIYDVLTAVEKIGAVTDLPLEHPSENHISIEPDKGLSIRLNNLSLGTDETGQSMLKNLSLDIKACERVGISGETGGGKTLLLQVLGGLHEDFQGSLSYNGLPMNNLNLESLRYVIGDSFQVEDIFAGTVYENITLGRPGIDLEQVRKVVSSLELSQWIENQENGYDTQLLPAGKGLPNTIVHRIKLARCLVINPRLLLLESPLNNLTGKARQAAREALTHAALTGTVVVVSNHREILERMDRIVWMENGSIRQQGTYAELSQNPEFNFILQ